MWTTSCRTKTTLTQKYPQKYRKQDWTGLCRSAAVYKHKQSNCVLSVTQVVLFVEGLKNVYFQHVATLYHLQYSKNIAVYFTSYLWKAGTDPPVISPCLACINEMTVAALCAPWNFYFLISFCVIAALAVPWLGDIIIVITTSSSGCRQIILPGYLFIFFFPFAAAPQRRGNYIFHQAFLLSVLWQRSYSIT